MLGVTLVTLNIRLFPDEIADCIDLAEPVVRSGHSLTAGEVVDWRRSRLASYKKPRYVEFLSAADVPRSVIGKILLLTEAAEEAYGPGGVKYVASATPMGRWGTEEEIAAWFVALCSPISSYVTGVIIPVDGGNAAGEGLSFRGGAFPG